MTRAKDTTKVPCKCGCGELIYKYNGEGQERFYEHGHQNRGKKFGGLGRFATSHGYVYVRTKTGFVLEHRLVMQQHLGRPLSIREDVHHINGIKDDNRIENLQLMDKSTHGYIHCRD